MSKEQLCACRGDAGAEQVARERAFGNEEVPGAGPREAYVAGNLDLIPSGMGEPFCTGKEVLGLFILEGHWMLWGWGGGAGVDVWCGLGDRRFLRLDW